MSRLPSWRLPIVRGTVALACAAAITMQTDPTLRWLAVTLGAYCAVDGAVIAAAGVRRSVLGLPWTWLLVRGACGVLAGVALVAGTAAGPAGVHRILAAWAVMSGVFDLAAGVRARGHVDGALFLVLNGLITAWLGVLLLLLPPGTLAAAAPLVALYAAMAGTVLLFLGVRLAYASPAAPGPTLRQRRV